MATSRYFPADGGAGGAREPSAALSVLKARRLKKRKRAVEAEAEAEAEGERRPLTEMERQVVALRREHPDKLLLFECGYRMRVFAEDAERAAAVLGIRATQYKNLVEASVPVHRALAHSRRLVRAGFKVGIVRQVDSAAGRAVSPARPGQRKPLERCVTDVYTRATIPAEDEEGGWDDPEANRELGDVGVGAARFIMCIVEATVHSTKLFVQLVHAMDDAAKQHHGATETVNVGVLAHDIHTGETSFAQFEDDAKRLRLKRILNSIEPIEFVLPRGGLSPYSERVVEDFTTGQRNRGDANGVGAYGQPSASVIRIERLDDAAFGVGEGIDARVQTTGVPWLSRLHPLCMRCFCGLHSFLSGLSLDRTLVSPRCTDVRHIVDSSISQFCLPPETQRDLDLFVNSTTQTYTGSLYSIMNHTKTEFGARRLRGWIQNPLVSLPELKERQDAVRFLAGGRSSDFDPHEELLVLLSRAKSLLRSLQRIHVGKATPSIVVNTLKVLVDVEERVVALAGFLHGATSLTSTGSLVRPRLVSDLLDTYPLVAARASACLAQIDASPAAKGNDVEGTVLRWLYRVEADKKRFEALAAELADIQAHYQRELLNCQEMLQDRAIEFKTHRGGSLRDIHHLIEVDRARLSFVPSDWLTVNSTKKLIRFHTREIVRLHLHEDFALQQKEQLVRSAWCAFVSHVDGELYASAMGCVDVLATLDALCSLATIGRQSLNYTMPQIEELDGSGRSWRVLEIEDGRHPILEALLEKSSYIENSVSLKSVDKQGAMLGISGPNMGGKTSLLRTCALIVVMAQVGSFAPATLARLSLFDGVFTVIQRQMWTDNCRRLPAATSSLRAHELSALSAVARSATRRSLVLIDEIGFGMASHHARALAVAHAVFFVDSVRCLLLFASHLADAMKTLKAKLGDKCSLKQFVYSTSDGADQSGENEYGDANYERVAFHYSMRDGVARDSLAMDTARRAGMPRRILEAAGAISSREHPEELQEHLHDA